MLALPKIIIKEMSLNGLVPTVANSHMHWHEPWSQLDDNDVAVSYRSVRLALGADKTIRQIMPETTRKALYAWQDPYYAAAAYVFEDCLVANILAPKRSDKYAHIIRAASLLEDKAKADDVMDKLGSMGLVRLYRTRFKDDCMTDKRIVEVKGMIEPGIEKLLDYLPGFLEGNM